MVKNNYAISFKADTNYIYGLDGLRAISILIVLVSHFGFGNIVPGGFGVTIFFFISGFLITRLLISEQNKKQGQIDLKNFYIRRFLRLMPALYVFIVFVCVLALFFNLKLYLIQILSACFYLVNYYDIAWAALELPKRIVPWGHLWSLAVEEHFYLLFPLALTIFGKKHDNRIKFVSILIILSAAWRLFGYEYLNFSDNRIYLATECRIENILWGCLLAILMDGAKTSKNRISNLIGWHWVFIGLCGIIGSLLFRNEEFRATWRYSIQSVSIFILIFNLYAFSSLNFAIKILDMKIFRFMGRLSYSLYLWHFPVLWAFYKFINVEIGLIPLPLDYAIYAAIISFALACGSYYLVERPFFELRKKFGAKPVEEMVRQ
ncbi:MAG: acyltransferase [Caulobacterales bacterium]|nr:acyltransferase [Caulobacterales bacterium]MCA0372330.1 acyltransferase [Pseudomonadota bacterium]